MLKFGTVELKDTNESYSFMWSTNDSTFERIDVFTDPHKYNYVDTTDCVAAYYKSTKAMFYKDDTLVKRILSTVNQASVFICPTKNDFDFVDGAPIMTQTKEDERVGIRMKRVQKFANLEYELYEVPDTKIEITVINKDKGMNIAPINKLDYVAYNITKDSMIGEVDVAEFYSMEYLRANHKIDHIDDCDYVVIESMEEADRRLQEWADAPTKIKAIDLETTGVETGMFGKDCITGIVLSYSEDDSTYFPFRQENFEYNLPISYMDKIINTVNNQPKDVLIIAWNAKFEIQGIWKENRHYIKYSPYAMAFNDKEEPGLDMPHLRIDADGFILSVLVDPRFVRDLHSLKHRASEVTGLEFLELSDIFKDKNNIKFNVLTKEHVRYYACPDTPNTIRAFKALLKKLPKDEYDIFALENRLLYISATNEFYGMRIKQDTLVDSLENEEYIVNTLADYFKKIHKTDKNINSADVRREIFYEKLRCPVEVRTKKGQPSTSNEALKRIVELGTLKEIPEGAKVHKDIVDLNKNPIVKGKDLAKNKYPSLVILDKYTKAMKELGAFKRIKRKSLRDRVMFSINQVGAATGRRTSDAHQYSDGMKKLVVGDSKYHYLWSADFKQIELRILAYLAGQTDLIELESNPDIDVHRAILSIIKHKPIWAISAKERKEGKSTNFGVVYMMSAYGLAKKNAGPAYTEEDLLAAYDSINGFYNGLPKIKAFVEKNKSDVQRKGFVKTEMGRYRFFREILDPSVTEAKKSSFLRAANNTPVQGFGADFLKEVECRLYAYIKEKGWDEVVDCDGVMLPKVRLMLSIHDEVLVSSHRSIPHEDIITMFKVCMELKVPGAPPFFAAPALVGTWYDGKLDKYEIDLRFRDQIVDKWDSERKRLLHVGTFCDSHQMEDVLQVEELSERLRHDFLTADDFDKDKHLVLSEEKVRFIQSQLSNEDKKLLLEAYISEHDNVVPVEQFGLALSRAMDEKFSHYLHDLAIFRNNRLRDYMEGLIAEYHTPEAVAEHVRHDELTHTLISVYITKDDKFDHMESIEVATRRYMEARAGDTMNLIKDAMVAEAKDELEDRAIIASFEELEEFIEFDDNGMAIIEEPTGDEDDRRTITDRSAYCKLDIEREYAFCFLDSITVDLLDFKKSDPIAEKIHQAIAKMHNPNGQYKVSYLINDKLVETPFRMDDNCMAINKLVQDCINESKAVNKV